MTTDTKEAEARARAHELLGEAICFAPRPDYHTSATCDRLTAELLSHAAALDELRRDLAAAIAERDRLRDALGVALEARDNWRAETNALAIERAEWESVVAERDRLRESLRVVALRGCDDDGHLHHPDECPAGDRCGSCPCSAHIADRALKATGET